VTNLAGHNTAEAAAFLTTQRKNGSNWFRECLILQRTARDIPSLAPTAFTASQLTPAKERIKGLANLRRGMVGYSKGVDPAGHIFFILGRRKGFDLEDPDGILTESNDVVAGKTGHVGIVPLSFYRVHWGHTFLFGATWLNGYDFADFNAKPKPVHPTLGANYDEAIKLITKAVKAHAKDKDQRLHDLLVKDLAKMKARAKRFS
jgi:hypothetical protein